MYEYVAVIYHGIQEPSGIPNCDIGACILYNVYRSSCFWINKILTWSKNTGDPVCGLPNLWLGAIIACLWITKVVGWSTNIGDPVYGLPKV